MNLPKTPIFSRQISLGNIVTIGSLLVGLTVGWVAMEARIAAAESEIARMVNLQATMSDKVRANEIAITRQDERWNQVSQFMGRIEANIQRIEQSLRGGQ